MAPPPNPDPNKVPPRSGGGNPPPPPPPPPPAAPKVITKGAAFDSFMKKHPALKKYADAIWKWSKVYGIDPVYFAALLWHESKGNPNASNRNEDGTVDLGIAQINGGAHPDIKPEDALNPAFAIRWAAKFFSAKVKAAGGDYTVAYNGAGGYNPGGPDPFTPLIPKSYVPKGSGLSPSESASVSVETAAERDALTAVWAVRTKDGVKFVQAAEPPKNTVKFNGMPVDQEGFMRARKYYNDIYQGYVGTNAPDAAIAHIMNSGLSDTGLMIRLSKSPKFKQGSIYQGRAAGLELRAKQLFGENWKADPELIRKAIVQNWDEATLVANLRKRPEYLRGPEFKKDEAGLLNVHMSIMGRPDDAARIGIKEAVLGGWSDDQYAAYLRGHESYKYSPELQSKQLAFAEAMGLITGAVPTLKPGQAQGQPLPNITPNVPNSDRIPGAPGLNPNNGMVVSSG